MQHASKQSEGCSATDGKRAGGFALLGRRARRRADRDALVLVLVLIVVMMIALAGFSFAELMLTENKAAHLHGDQLRLQQAIHSGVEQLKLFFEQPLAARTAAGGSFDNPALFRAVALEAEQRRTPAARRPRFSVVAATLEASVQGGLGGVRFGVENESGRLHLADLLRYEQYRPGAGREALLQLPGMSEAVAEAILDWIDADSQPRPMGAESDYYGGLPRPYAARNGLPESLEELLLVKGVTRQMLFGGDRNYNRKLDPEELMRPDRGPRTATATSTPPWAWLLTVYSGQRNVNSTGSARVHLNNMNLSQLHAQLSTAIDPNLAAFAVAYRQYGPYAGGDGVPAGGAPPLDLSAAPRFAIASVLDLAGVQVAVPAGSGEPPQVYDSPLPGDPRSVAERMPKLLDATTITVMRVIRGLVSVNHAPPSVLAAVPGIDAALAQRIVAARQQSLSSDEASRQSAVWLYTEGLVNLETMKRLMPFVTAGGDVVRAQIIGHFDEPGLAARAEVVIDATSVPSRIAAWRDLRFHGLGFPLERIVSESSWTARN